MGQSMTLMGFYQDRLQSSTHAVRPASACTQPSANGLGGLECDRLCQHSEDSRDNTRVPGSYGKDGVTLDLGSNQYWLSPRLASLLLHKSRHRKH